MHPGFFDYIIVGQGLAGSAVSMQLLWRRKKIVVIDEALPYTATRVAAGLFNPITGRNNTKTWLADELFPYLHRFYLETEQATKGKFLFPMPVYRPFSSPEEQNDWMGRSTSENYSPYIETIHNRSLNETGIHDPFGGILVKQSGYLDTKAYLRAVKRYVEAHAVYLDENWEENRLAIEKDGVEYKGYRAQRIIFCQGYRSIENKWFKFAEIRPLKGETLLIKTGWKKDVILNRGVYMVRSAREQEFKVGATYGFNDSSPGKTPEARNELEEKLKAVYTLPYEVLQQEWGIRPTTRNRRPVLGSHPDSDRLVIFNGLGTKGVSLAPYFSELLIRSLENDTLLHKDIAVTRFI